MNYYIGQRFGKVVIIGEEKYEKNRKYVKVKCDCGKTKYVRILFIRRKRYLHMRKMEE